MRNREDSIARYQRLAPHYDHWSGEPIYRAGRELVFAELDLRAGNTVVDVGCGTGLNFAGLQRLIGPTGSIIGVDASAAMLDRAGSRLARHRWSNVELIEADASDVDPDELLTAGKARVDAAIASYALSLMPNWPQAWALMLDLVRPGGRLAVIDMALPDGAARAFAPLARAACALGGADIDAHPWTALERDCDDVVRRRAWGGHVQVAVGTRRAGRTVRGDLQDQPHE